MVTSAAQDIVFWLAWYQKWRRRIECLATADLGPRAGRRHRAVRASQVLTAWILIEMPAVHEHHVMPGWWLALSLDDRRGKPTPRPIAEYRRVPAATSMKPGFSLDTVGPYLKLDDGTVLRDRRSAARRLWRQIRRNPDLAKVIDWLPQRTSSRDRPVKGRTAERVLEALVCRSLVELGSTQLDAAMTVIAWSRHDRDPQRHADESRVIWREAKIPVVSR